MKAAGEHVVNIIVWKQRRNTEDAPYRRKGDRRFTFKFTHPSGGRQIDWPWVLSQIGRHAVHIETFYCRSLRGRLVQVFIGDRAVLKEHRS